MTEGAASVVCGALLPDDGLAGGFGRQRRWVVHAAESLRVAAFIDDGDVTRAPSLG